MDDLDNRLIAALRRDARASLSQLALDLAVTRATVRARMQRLEASGAIAGYTVLTREDVADHAVRGLMMLAIGGHGTEKVERYLRGLPEVQAVHSTNGTWDLIAEIGVGSLEDFDRVLTRIRKLDSVTRSETSLLLSTRR